MYYADKNYELYNYRLYASFLENYIEAATHYNSKEIEKVFKEFIKECKNLDFGNGDIRNDMQALLDSLWEKHFENIQTI